MKRTAYFKFQIKLSVHTTISWVSWTSFWKREILLMHQADTNQASANTHHNTKAKQKQEEPMATPLSSRETPPSNS